MKVHKLLVGLYALLVAIGTVRGSNIKSTNIVEIIGDSGLTNSAHLSSKQPEKKSSLYDFGTSVILVKAPEQPDHSPFVRLIDFFMPEIGDEIEHKSNFKLFQYEGGSLISYESRYLLRSIETRDVLSWGCRAGCDSEIEILRIDFVGPSLKENVLVSVCFKHSW